MKERSGRRGRRDNQGPRAHSLIQVASPLQLRAPKGAVSLGTELTGGCSYVIPLIDPGGGGGGGGAGGKRTAREFGK